MTDLQFKILTLVHDYPDATPPEEHNLVNGLVASGDASINGAALAVSDLKTLRCLTLFPGTRRLSVTPHGLEELEAARDLRRREALLQQQLQANAEEQKARDARHEQEKALDQKISKLAIIFAVVTGLLAPAVSVLAAHYLPLLLWS